MRDKNNENTVETKSVKFIQSDFKDERLERKVNRRHIDCCRNQANNKANIAVRPIGGLIVEYQIRPIVVAKLEIWDTIIAMSKCIGAAWSW